MNRKRRAAERTSSPPLPRHARTAKLFGERFLAKPVWRFLPIFSDRGDLYDTTPSGDGVPSDLKLNAIERFDVFQLRLSNRLAPQANVRSGLGDDEAAKVFGIVEEFYSAAWRALPSFLTLLAQVLAFLQHAYGANDAIGL